MTVQAVAASAAALAAGAGSGLEVAPEAPSSGCRHASGTSAPLLPSAWVPAPPPHPVRSGSDASHVMSGMGDTAAV